MEQIPYILATLAALCASLLFVRTRWQTWPLRPRRLALAASLLAILVILFAYATHWVTTSDRLNAAIYWSAIAGYLLLLTVHSLAQPRWLTSLTAIVLAIPILSASLLLPLATLFHPQPRRIVPLGRHLYASWQPFMESGPASAGVDVEVLSRPPWLPFLQHSRLGGRFFNMRCNAQATQLSLQPDGETVFVRCPLWTGAGGGSETGDYIRLH